MAGEWPVVSVADLESQKILLVQDGNHGEYRPRPDEFVSSGVAFIRAADMDNGRILFESASKINDAARRRITKGVGKPGDILLSHKGTVGKVASAPMDCPEFVCSPQTTFWRTLDGSKLDRGYLHAYLNGQHFRDQLASRSAETDMAPYVSLTSQRGLSLILPPITTQQAISRVLRPLDDKIELNRRMNATLEGISRAIFKSWFVDFDPVRQKAAGKQPIGMDAQTAALFPDSFENSEVGEVPKGWQVQPIGEFAAVEKGLSYKGSGLVEEDGIPMVNLGCFQGAGKFAPDNIKHYAGEYAERHLVSGGDLLVANTDMTQKRLILGSPAIISESTPKNVILFTHHVFALRFQPEAKHLRRYVYYCLLRPDFRTIAEGFATGTTVLALPKEAILTYAVCLPPDGVLDAFTKQTDRCANLCEVNEEQSRTLAALRDTLLPKLLSGEIRVFEAEQAVEEAVG